MMNTHIGSKSKSHIWVVSQDHVHQRLDYVTVEEPLEIRLVEQNFTVAVTMRTPGADFALAAGFLYCEGVVSCREDIRSISYCQSGKIRQNIVNVALRSHLIPDLQPLSRHFYTSSACGVCGKASLEALRLRNYPPLAPLPLVTPEIIYKLPQQLKASQTIFKSTGGLHAAAIFDAEGQLISAQEDVGRHNALDKLIGVALLGHQLPLSHHILMVSGRSSFEILQKSVAAGIPIVCSVSAPSSLAVSVAEEFGTTLIGFLRAEQFNIYTGQQRIKISTKDR
jgi:FdhD protein